MDKLYYLKADTQIEPLVNQWHAYPYVIAPAAASMITQYYQMDVMASYIKMPMAHAAALKNPDMVGGPFIDYEGGRVDEIAALKEQIEEKADHLIRMGISIKELYSILTDKNVGLPLEEVYQEVPEDLRGYIELVYDLENNPSFRFIENLLYEGGYYNREFQTIALTTIKNDKRSFIFSTPRLESKEVVHLPISFEDQRIDQLNDLKTNGKTLKDIQSILQIDDEKLESIKQFFSETPFKKTENYQGRDLRIRYFGHACVLIESCGKAILSDPLVSYKYDTDIDRFTFEDLPETIDYVVITHAHHDHIVLETLLQLRKKIKTIIVPKGGNGYLQDPSMKLILTNIGFNSVIELDELETIKDDELTITGIPFYGEHCDLDIKSKLVYKVGISGKSIMLAADSSSINPDVYKNTQKIVGDVDLLFIGLECTGAPMSWSYGPFFKNKIDRKIDQQRRSKGSNSESAISLIEIFNAKQVFLYAMGLEPWLGYFMALQHSHSENTDEECEKLITYCQDHEIEIEKLFAKKELHL